MYSTRFVLYIHWKFMTYIILGEKTFSYTIMIIKMIWLHIKYNTNKNNERLKFYGVEQLLPTSTKYLNNYLYQVFQINRKAFSIINFLHKLVLRSVFLG